MIESTEADDEWGDVLYEGLDVDFSFADGAGPNLGDLRFVCGIEPSAAFPLSGRFDLAPLRPFGFEQVDDYFGIWNHDGAGSDVSLWLFPLRRGTPTYHDPGPFDGLRISYNVLRNSPARADLFVNCVAACSRAFRVQGSYPFRELPLGMPMDVAPLVSDVNAIVRYWRSQSIEPGSSEALRVDY